MSSVRPRDLLALLDQQANDALSFEQKVIEDVTRPLRDLLRRVIRGTTRHWIEVTGGLDVDPTPAQVPGLVAFFLEAYAGVRKVSIDLGPVALAAIALGIDHARQHSDVSHAALRARRVPMDLKALVEAAPKALIEQISNAERLLVIGQLTAATRTASLAGVNYTATRLESAVATVVTRGISAGVQQSAELAHAELLWRAERDGCLHCLAYAGEVAGHQGFAWGRTFADKPLKARPAALYALPPLHPRCRCQLVVWAGEDGPDAAPTAMRREARRSVALGFALESESDPARRRAADRLLSSGADLPKTVEERARRAVDNRKPFRRPVP